jgi:ABC-2 type transport system ATP-binding protein
MAFTSLLTRSLYQCRTLFDQERTVIEKFVHRSRSEIGVRGNGATMTASPSASASTSPSTEPPVIEAHGITKRYGKVQALDGLDLVVPSGQVVALLGPNGAGKTTFVRTIATLVRPDGGTLRVAGVDAVRRPEKVRRAIGLAGQYAAVEEALTGRENLVMVAKLFGHSSRTAKASAAAIVDRLGLNDAADRLVRTYSGGMRRRLDLGASLVGAPRLLLLDEPTTGLDPRSRIELWDAIRGLVRQGTDVLLTTQYLDEADQLADRVVIVDKGRVIADGTPSQLKSEAGRDVVEIHARRVEDLAAIADAVAPFGVEAVRLDRATRSAAMPIDGGTSRLMEAVRALDEVGIEVDDVGLRRPTLDEVFLALTGQHIEIEDDDGADHPDDPEPDDRSLTAIAS